MSTKGGGGGGTPKSEAPPTTKTRDELVFTGNESSEILTLNGNSSGSQIDEFQNGERGNTMQQNFQNGSVCNGCPEIPQYMLDVLSENSRREFRERLAKSVCFFKSFCSINP